jgi:phosphonate degradation associated HDIG domain protein
MMDTISMVASLLAEKGQRPYGLHDVSQLQHALQTALLAEQAGSGAALIAAALLHDIGHMVHELGENPAESGIDDRHEMFGHVFLEHRFIPDVTDPVRLHVAAKRYLCAVDPGYAACLSPDSVLSLKLQGGPMTPDEVMAFRAEPHAEAAIQLRRFDDMAKVKDLPTPPVEHFLPALARCLRESDPAPAGRP